MEPPFQETTLLDKLWWSQWLESMRKDVKCTFGILKLGGSVTKVGKHAASFTIGF
jgi:hypothetical protein